MRSHPCFVALLLLASGPAQAGVVYTACTGRSSTDSLKNVLVADCVVGTLPNTLPARVAYRELGETGDWSYSDPAEEFSVPHSLTLYALKADTTYEVFGQSAVDGVTWLPTDSSSSPATFTTGSLPDAFGDLALTVTTPCTGCDTDLILGHATCTGTWPTQSSILYMTDTDGTIRWYFNLSNVGFGASPKITGLRWTRDNSALVVLDHQFMVEVDRDGQVTRVLCASTSGTCVGGRAADLTRLLHHDAFKVDSRTYAVLTAEVVGFDCDDDPETPDTLITVDGVTYVQLAGPGSSSWVDESAMVHWQVTDIFDDACTAYGKATSYWDSSFDRDGDWTLANSIDVNDDGDWTLSLRGLNSVIRVFGPDHANAGQLDWTLDDGTASDFTDLSGEEFCGQHHATSILTGGTTESLLMFDNYWGSFASGDCLCPAKDCSRGLQLDLDLTTMELTTATSWDMGLSCFSTGSTYLTENGNALNTCGPEGLILENDTAGNSLWGMTVGCIHPGTGVESIQPLYRSVPVTGL
jgi:hypothetical protein